MPEVIVFAKQGLAIGGPAEVGFDKGTLHYVPGSTLRGALAAAWIQRYGIPDTSNQRRDEFIGLFERDIRYGPLFQDGTSITPLSARWCKYPATPACEVWSADAATDPDADACPHCERPADSGKGEVAGVRVRRVVRTKLDKQGRAEDANLFARHELEPRLTYRGQLAGDHPWLTEPREIWLGGRTTTSGLATFEVAPTAEPPDGQVIPASPRSDGALVVKLTSPALVVDDAGRPIFDPAQEILRVLGLPAAMPRQSMCWTRPVRVGGWHAASGTPKPIEHAMAMGSVVVLHLDPQPAPGRLAKLASDGIGLRRIEGFGAVDINPAAWRRALAQSPRAADAEAPESSVLTRLRDEALLDDETLLRWLVDRCRMVLVERLRDPGFTHGSLLTERVAVYFSDAQADAVGELFSSPRLAAAIPILEQILDQVTTTHPAEGRGEQR